MEEKKNKKYPGISKATNCFIDIVFTDMHVYFKRKKCKGSVSVFADYSILEKPVKPGVNLYIVTLILLG